MKSNDDGLCGCGKPIKYMNSDGRGACNKHMRCPTYDELSKRNKELGSELIKALTKALALSTYKENTSQYQNSLADIRTMAKSLGMFI